MASRCIVASRSTHPRLRFIVQVRERLFGISFIDTDLLIVVGVPKSSSLLKECTWLRMGLADNGIAVAVKMKVSTIIHKCSIRNTTGDANSMC